MCLFTHSLISLTLPFSFRLFFPVDVVKTGDARVAMIGFPSVGKSTLLSTLTPTQSEVRHPYPHLLSIHHNFSANVAHRPRYIQLYPYSHSLHPFPSSLSLSLSLSVFPFPL